MTNLFTLLFAPSFLVLIRYFEFKTVVLVYILLSLSFFIFSFIKKKKIEDFIVVTIYLVLLTAAYFSSSFETVKFIPIFASMIFVALFIDAAINKKHLILKFTQRFYPKKLCDAEVEFLKNGDSFWAISLSIYLIITIIVLFLASDITWAIMTSIGWYIYFAITLTSQILYGKLYAIKMYSK